MTTLNQILPHYNSVIAEQVDAANRQIILARFTPGAIVKRYEDAIYKIESTRVHVSVYGGAHVEVTAFGRKWLKSNQWGKRIVHIDNFMNLNLLTKLEKGM